MILITHPDLKNIKDRYVKNVQAKVEDRILNLNSISKFILSSTPIKSKDIKFKNHNRALYAFLNRRPRGRQTIQKTLSLLNRTRREHASHKSRLKLIGTITALLKSAKVNAILSQGPKALLRIQRTLLLAFQCDKSDLVLEYIFSYDDFYKSEITKIAAELAIRVCPYCNRSYITHVQDIGGNRIVGPSFDHFFSHDKNPILAVSFFNLIPSCTLCNSNRKGVKQFDLENHIHPYFHQFGDDAVFDFNLIGGAEWKKIDFQPHIRITASLNSKIRQQLTGDGSKDSGTLNVFRLQEIYSTHSDVVEEIHEKFDENSPHYSKSIRTFLSGLQTNEDEFYRFNFSNYFEPTDHLKRPLAKMSRDVYNKMKEIYRVVHSYSTIRN